MIWYSFKHFIKQIRAMAKSIILLLNITGLIFLELFYGENVTVKQNVPSSLELNIGDTISVSISMNLSPLIF